MSAVLDIEDTPPATQRVHRGGARDAEHTPLSPCCCGGGCGGGGGGGSCTPENYVGAEGGGGYSTFRLDVEEETLLRQWRAAREQWRRSAAAAAECVRT